MVRSVPLCDVLYTTSGLNVRHLPGTHLSVMPSHGRNQWSDMFIFISVQMLSTALLGYSNTAMADLGTPPARRNLDVHCELTACRYYTRFESFLYSRCGVRWPTCVGTADGGFVGRPQAVSCHIRGQRHRAETSLLKHSRLAVNVLDTREARCSPVQCSLSSRSWLPPYSVVSLILLAYIPECRCC